MLARYTCARLHTSRLKPRLCSSFSIVCVCEFVVLQAPVLDMYVMFEVAIVLSPLEVYEISDEVETVDRVSDARGGADVTDPVVIKSGQRHGVVL
jgi:hypothetical protein